MLCIGLLSFAVTIILPPTGKAWAALVLLACSLVCLISALCLRSRRRWLCRIALTACLAALPLLISHTVIDIPISHADSKEPQSVSCTVTDVLSLTESTASCRVTVTSIDGKDADYGASALLPADVGSVGCVLRGTAVLTPVTSLANGSALLAQGILLRIDDLTVDEFAFTELHISPLLRENPCTTALKKLFQARTDSETASLLTALFLGDTSYFSPPTNLGFQRLGLSHLSAISGMNVTLLICLFELLLRRMHLAKSLRLTVCLAALFFYLWMVGFAASALRAAVMQTIVICAFVLRRQHDLLTVLTVAAYVMCLCAPFTVYSVSFWLSVAATAGILLVVDKERQAPPPSLTAELVRVQTATQREALWRKALAYAAIPCKRLLHICRLDLTVGLAAVCATLPIAVLLFGTFSPLSPLATLLCTPFVQLLLYAACFFPLICLCPPLVFLVEKTAALLVWGVQCLSSHDAVLLYVDYLPILLITTVLVLLLFLYQIPAWPKRLSKLTCLIALLLSALLLHGQYAANKSTVRLAYQPDTSEPAIALSYEEEILYIDVSNGRSGNGYSCLQAAQAMESTLIHHYVVTDYDSGLHTRFRRICADIKLKQVYLPTPLSQTEQAEADRLVEFLSSCRIGTAFYEAGKPYLLKEDLTFTYTEAADNTGNQTPILWVNSRGHTCLYMSLSRLKTSHMTVFDQAIAQADAVILTNVSGDDAAQAVTRLRRLCGEDTHIILKRSSPLELPQALGHLQYASADGLLIDLD